MTPPIMQHVPYGIVIRCAFCSLQTTRRVYLAPLESVKSGCIPCLSSHWLIERVQWQGSSLQRHSRLLRGGPTPCRSRSRASLNIGEALNAALPEERSGSVCQILSWQYILPMTVGYRETRQRRRCLAPVLTTYITGCGCYIERPRASLGPRPACVAKLSPQCTPHSTPHSVRMWSRRQ